MPPIFLKLLISAALLLIVAGYILTNTSFYYPVDFANDPLIAPIRVTSYSTTHITLEDGRTLAIDPSDANFIDHLHDSSDRVDIETTGTITEILGCRRIFYCGTGSPPFHIPLFPYKRKLFYRHTIAYTR